MSIQFQAIKSLLFNILVTLIVLSFITTASYIQQQNTIGQIEATVVFNGSATSIDEIGKGSDASFAADIFTSTTKPEQKEQKGEVSQYEQTFMEAEISNALNSSSLTNQTAPTTTLTSSREKQQEMTSIL